METIVPAPSVPPTSGNEQPTAPNLLPVLSGPPMPWSREYEGRVLSMIGANSNWMREHEVELLKEHPDWWGKTVVVAASTPSKILAVHEDWWEAIEQALQSVELQEAARREGLPPGELALPIFLGDQYM